MKHITYERHGVTFALKDTTALTGDHLKALTGSVEIVGELLGVEPAGIWYLLNYGFRQSMQDAVASTAKRVEDKLVKEADEAGDPAPTDEAIDEAVKAAELDDLGDRRKDIVNGDVQVRGGQRDPFGTMCKTIALQIVREAHKTAKKTMPKDTDKVNELVAKVIASNRESIEKEANRRLTPVKGVKFDLNGVI